MELLPPGAQDCTTWGQRGPSSSQLSPELQALSRGDPKVPPVPSSPTGTPCFPPSPHKGAGQKGCDTADSTLQRPTVDSNPRSEGAQILLG